MSTPSTPATSPVDSSALLAADDTLETLAKEMAAEFQRDGEAWPRDWMQKHVNDREIIIKARRVLIDRAEAANSVLSKPVS